MFRCTICQKLHSTRVEYCDCGNDTFEEISESLVDNRHREISLQEIFSWVIFLICILLSVYIMFFTGSKSVKKNIVNQQQSIQVKDIQIPDIDKIWDNTPPVGSNPHSSREMDIYKKGLENILYSNLSNRTISTSGECEIEFRIASDGSLTNRKLYKRQGDKNFNNIVLNMLKNTSKYKTPPIDYSGEKIKVYVYTNNEEIKIYVK